MLSNFVNENHTDWDEHLPYVMMAYRSTIHETTGFSPNSLMLGREVCTPLDIMYDVPSAIKPMPRNEWVWQLQERLENAHKIVRTNTQQAMIRQKHYHDKKLNWAQFNENDEVYVYFPRTKSGQSPKFTSYWRGPFRIIKKMSDVTYMVNCGIRGSNQVIHVDRMRLKRSQLLVGETPAGVQEPRDDTIHDSGQACSDDTNVTKAKCDSDSSVTNGEDSNEIGSENKEELPERQFRCRRPPLWLKDYETDY